MCGTPSATTAFEGVYLPYPLHGGAFFKREAQQTCQAEPQRIACHASYELSPVVKFAHGLRVFDALQLSALPQLWQAALLLSAADVASGPFERARKPMMAMAAIRMARIHFRPVCSDSIFVFFICLTYQ